jgi:ubiquitin-binding protein
VAYATATGGNDQDAAWGLRRGHGIVASRRTRLAAYNGGLGMTTTVPTTVSDAELAMQVKILLPNLLTNKELNEFLAQLPADIRQAVLAVSGVYDASVLDKLREVVLKMASGTEDFASARLDLKTLMKQVGTPAELMEEGRLNLMISTQLDLARGIGRKIQGNDPRVIEGFPCWEYVRLGTRRVPRDWPTRWNIAKADAGDETATLPSSGQAGPMIARKDSGIWAALGRGAGGYSDALHVDFPPFAFNSGMGWISCARRRAEEFGVVTPEDVITPQVLPDFGKMLQVSVDLRSEALKAALLEKFPNLKFVDGVLTSQ